MTEYIYATRTVVKTGNKLMTSYGNVAQAKKYGGESAAIFKGLKYFDVDTCSVNMDGVGYILRSKMKANNTVSGTGGKFALYSIVENKCVDTGLRFKTYGEANSTMKAMTAVYSDMVVLEMSDSIGTSSDEGYNDDVDF